MHNNVDLLQTTTQYSTSGEIEGTGYSAGGATMSGATAGIDNANHVAWYTFNDVTFSSSSLTADTVLLYNNSVSSPTNKPSIGVFYLGSAKTSSSGDFKIVMPTANFSSALVRLA
tara:strand:+ start:6778 stop:7122 length:345 start_codon:yes stop_codon:yes gene_type:complete